jgi:integrase
MEEIHRQLRNRYSTSGYSDHVIRSDWQILRRIGVHPALATYADLEAVVLKAKKQSTKANYVARLRSIYNHLNKMNLVNGHNPALDLPQVKAGRGVPKPITKAEFEKLLAEAKPPYRDWFVLGGMVGLRAMEAANIQGSDLIETEGGYSLRVLGKGGTDLIIPVAPAVAEMIKATIPWAGYGKSLPTNFPIVQRTKCAEFLAKMQSTSIPCAIILQQQCWKSPAVTLSPSRSLCATHPLPPLRFTLSLLKVALALSSISSNRRI